MKKRVERLRGMHDLLPDIYQRQHHTIEQLGAFLARAGYDRVDAPLLENSDLFLASFGQELWQNLYTFRLHNRDLCLRPEYTASICRLYLDHYQHSPLPLRFQYAGPVFRYETPGRGRYRQHTQLGVELLGGHATSADSEILQLACDALNEVRIPNYRLELGHVGVASGFIQRLRLDEQAARLLLSLMEQISRSQEGEQAAHARLEMLYPAETVEAQNSNTARDAGERFLTSLLNGMTALNTNDASRQEIIDRFLWKMGRSEQRRQILYALDLLRELHGAAGSPPEAFGALRDILSRYQIDAAPLAELEQLVTVVEQSGVPRERITLNLALGRGVSYYTGLVFEIHAQDAEGYDTQICGGGRYDSLMQAIGATRPVKACGFTFGVERLLALIPEEEFPASSATQTIIIPISAQDMPYALQVARAARAQGVRAEIDITGHGLSAGLKLAVKKHITHALIVGENEAREERVTLRNLASGEEHSYELNAAMRHMRDKERINEL
ncbi:MAG TPA: histidine--tRNA ligase [Ktedonobacteraceae bacterium]|nr:histidine--tRNA ligase [Ktedonobacteraceae bacterium]